MKHKFIFCGCTSPSLRSASWLIYIRFCYELSAAICRGNLPWLSAVAICRGNLPWLFAVGICRGYLPWLSVVGICHGYLPWEFAVGSFCVCQQTFFLCEQIFFLCKKTFYIWKQNIFFIYESFFVNSVSFCYCLGSYGPPYFRLFKKMSYIFSGLVFFRLNL